MTSRLRLAAIVAALSAVVLAAVTLLTLRYLAPTTGPADTTTPADATTTTAVPVTTVTTLPNEDFPPAPDPTFSDDHLIPPSSTPQPDQPITGAGANPDLQHPLNLPNPAAGSPDSETAQANLVSAAVSSYLVALEAWPPDDWRLPAEDVLVLSLEAYEPSTFFTYGPDTHSDNPRLIHLARSGPRQLTLTAYAPDAGLCWALTVDDTTSELDSAAVPATACAGTQTPATQEPHLEDPDTSSTNNAPNTDDFSSNPVNAPTNPDSSPNLNSDTNPVPDSVVSREPIFTPPAD